MTFEFSQDPIIRHIQEETNNNNQSFYIIFTGAGGSGKSYACMETLRLCDPNFNIDRIAFTNEEFIQLLKQKLPAGSAIMWDEIGVGLDSREFMSLINKVLSYVTMTMRYRRQIIGMTVPDMQWIDLKTRKLLHAYVEMLKQFRSQRSIGKYHSLQTNYRYGKTYHKCPVVFNNNIPYVVSLVEFNHPPNILTEPYERRKIKFGDEVLEEAEEVVRQMKYKKGMRKVSDREIIGYVQENKEEFVRDKVIDVDKIALKFDLNQQRKNQLRHKLEAGGLKYKKRKHKESKSLNQIGFENQT